MFHRQYNVHSYRLPNIGHVNVYQMVFQKNEPEIHTINYMLFSTYAMLTWHIGAIMVPAIEAAQVTRIAQGCR